ncbi:GIY-YIG nuclease family protein [Azospirillum brasilense]|uniref:GIY-YIG nuclease family protein n=1 Tax=Azospirillum brasilense TaxID=192 RepID=A0A0P0F7J7_AZOBR|nr:MULTISPECIES: GIY-YIG nuclease family protein [Azospirillum]ALJ36895.1 endonuclease [Azospirillum brasilense]MDW7551565.1 GIY-YIG nuclease family protein [Azospirillum brasilense]MDW7591000.1 GIY-YIG nuclease family protein [Azospirillum brasilense]MDW7632704.1 GIY-YIG nuclease family protein [Azospirillum brasilense]MDX5951482.1 GIY-YIG nuclease family protein [Azospirillum brasilense]
MTLGRSIRLFLADGVPGGIITAEIVNWTGHVMVAPRSRLPDLLRRSEAGRTGVYFLAGDDPEGTLSSLVYVGETDNVGKRLAQHNRDEDKAFWDRACVVTSKDHNLTKAHARYLESRLIAIAGQAGRAKLVNGTAPDYGLLPEADIADMEFFIEQVRTVLPVLGLEFLREPPRVSVAAAHPETDTPTSMPVAAPVFELVSQKHELRAEAREIDGEFVVLEGSWARGDGSDSWNSYRALRDTLKNDGTLKVQGDYLQFTRDRAFRSPSAASAVILDRNDNGRTTWRVKGTSKTYSQWQQERIDAVDPTGSEE